MPQHAPSCAVFLIDTVGRPLCVFGRWVPVPREYPRCYTVHAFVCMSDERVRQRSYVCACDGPFCVLLEHQRYPVSLRVRVSLGERL